MNINNEWLEVKKDWVYQRKKTFIFKSWNPRYMVLYSRPCPAVALYEQRSDSVAPYAPILHLEFIPQLRIECYGKEHQGQSSHNDSMASMASSRHPDDFHSQARRGSITSLASDSRISKSKKRMEESALVIIRPGTDNQAPLKIVISLVSVEERDDWVFKMKSLINSLLISQQSIHSVLADEPLPAELKISHAASSCHTGLSCLGVTIIKDSKLLKLQENQPFLLSNSQSESNSLLNEIVLNVQQRCKLVDNVFPEEFIAKYYQNLKMSKKNPGDCIRTNLQLFRILATFNDDVCKYVRIIIDEYHRKVPVNSSAIYEFGPIQISLLPGYNQNDDTIIEYTNTTNRQELHTIRWINGSPSTDVNTLLVTCVEYKGFRFSASIDIPLGSNTISLELCPSEGKPVLIKEEQLDELNNIGTTLNLALNSHIRLCDNRTVTLSLPPSVELHHLPRNIAGYPKGTYIHNLSQIPPSWPVNPDNYLLCGLYRFRPEFLKAYPITLSASDFNAEKSLTAFKYLVDDHLSAVLERLESLEQVPIDSLEWTNWLHSHGINCVLLGRLASKTRLPHIREHLMIEMIARTAKKAIQAQLRGSILHFKEVQALKVEEELRAIVLHTLATIVGNTSSDMIGYVVELLEAVKYKFDFRIDLDTLRNLPRAAVFLAIQHHSGLQFVDRIYDFNMMAPFAKEDFLMFVPTMDNGPIALNTTNSCFSTLYRKEFNDMNGNNSGSSLEEALTETEALYRLGQQVLPLGESTWQYPTHRAAIACQFTVLSRIHAQQRRPSEASKYLDLARATAPKVHAVRAFIELEFMSQKVVTFKLSNSYSQVVTRDLFAELKRLYSKAVAEVEIHLGSHHPLIICVHQEVANLFTSLSQNYSAILTESLLARQCALAASTKALGRIHKWTRTQVLKIGDINKNMGNLDDALNFYQDAFKSAQQCGADSLALGEICLAISNCQQDKGDLDEALSSAKRARILLEGSSSAVSPKDFPTNKTETTINHFNNRNEALERAYTVISELAQKIYEDVREDSNSVLSEDIQIHLNLAVECYERLFDGIRQKPEIDGAKLLAVLKRIINLKFRLARPSQKILLTAIKGRKISASQSFVSECIMRIVASPSATIFMDRNLDKLEKPNIAAALSSGLNSSGEAKELFDEISCLLQIIES